MMIIIAIWLNIYRIEAALLLLTLHVQSNLNVNDLHAFDLNRKKKIPWKHLIELSCDSN